MLAFCRNKEDETCCRQQRQQTSQNRKPLFLPHGERNKTKHGCCLYRGLQAAPTIGTVNREHKYQNADDKHCQHNQDSGTQLRSRQLNVPIFCTSKEMPPDNAATVAPGTDVSFPQDGPISGSAITRITASSFNLANIGTYQVLFQVSVTEAGQLILTLNTADLAYTVVGRATGTSQIVGLALVKTSSINSILTVRNPAGNSPALTITPLAGGTRPVSAHLVIMQIA